EAVANHWPAFWQELSNERFDIEWLSDPYQMKRLVVFLDLMEKEVAQKIGAETLSRVDWQTDVGEDLRVTQKDQIWKESAQQDASSGVANDTTPRESGQALAELFERIAEHHLIAPTFITDFPKPISPLSKASPIDPTIAERFELFITGFECANGFSELNDPKEQYDRFNDQVKQRERGDEEAMVMDEDYIRALSYGMPPAAGIGIGIDRFVMLLTNQQSIRDVILFPHMRPERKRDVNGIG